jgi:DegV family protein with EDD domain
MLHIVMDTAGDMPGYWETKYNITTIPINIQFGESTYLSGIDISDEEFYRIANETGEIPKTSQPSPKQFVNLYERISKPGDSILSIHVTGKLSGTFESAQLAARELAEKIQVIPFDSYSGTTAMGYMCREARKLDQAGASVQAIINRLNQIRQQVKIVFTLNNLEYARMSGRVRALQAVLASVLNVKPIIDLKDGVLDIADSVRTRRKSMDYLLNYMKKRFNLRPVYASVVHAQDPEAGAILLKRVKETLNCQDLIFSELSIGIAANLGPGTIGIVAFPVEEG